MPLVRCSSKGTSVAIASTRDSLNQLHIFSRILISYSISISFPDYREIRDKYQALLEKGSPASEDSKVTEQMKAERDMLKHQVCKPVDVFSAQ